MKEKAETGFNYNNSRDDDTPYLNVTWQFWFSYVNEMVGVVIFLKSHVKK